MARKSGLIERITHTRAGGTHENSRCRTDPSSQQAVERLGSARFYCRALRMGIAGRVLSLHAARLW